MFISDFKGRRKIFDKILALFIKHVIIYFINLLFLFGIMDNNFDKSSYLFMDTGPDNSDNIGDIGMLDSGLLGSQYESSKQIRLRKLETREKIRRKLAQREARYIKKDELIWRGRDLTVLDPRERKKIFKKRSRIGAKGKGFVGLCGQEVSVDSGHNLDQNKLDADNKLLGMNPLFNFLGEKRGYINENNVNTFLKEPDRIKKLEYLIKMPLLEAIESIKRKSMDEDTYAYSYLLKRLDFYLKIVKEEPIQIIKKEWNFELQKEVTYTEEIEIPFHTVTKNDLLIGLKRDLLYASMIASPELAIFIMASKKISNQYISNLPQIRGAISLIKDDSIGYAYPSLNKLFKEAYRFIERKEINLDEKQIEYKAVRQAVSWIEEGVNYNNPERGPLSPYVSDLEESVAWARLGDRRVKKQLRGMRRKIIGINLSNIKRFIGRSGSNPYAKEKSILDYQIDLFESGNLSEQEFIEIKNKEDNFWVDKKSKLLDKTLHSLKKRRDKNVSYILELELAEKEKDFEINRIETGYQKEIDDANSRFEREVKYIEARGKDEICSDLIEQKNIVDHKYNKRKNLLQKALDLYWMQGIVPYLDSDEYIPRRRFSRDQGEGNEGAEDLENTLIYDPIDWINVAPFRTIEKAHKMLREGMEPEKIIKYAVFDIVCGKHGGTRDDLKVISGYYDRVKNDEVEARDELQALIEVGNILSSFDITLAEIMKISKQCYYGLDQILKEYSLEETKQFLDLGCNLVKIYDIKKIVDDSGINLSTEDICMLSKYSINGLKEALQCFDISEIKILVKNYVCLLTAVRVQKNKKIFKKDITFTDIIDFASNTGYESGWYKGLLDMPFAKIKILYGYKVDYDDFKLVDQTLISKGYRLELMEIIELINKLSLSDISYGLKRALQKFTLAQINYIILHYQVYSGLSNIMDIVDILSKRNNDLELDELLKIVRCISEFPYTEFFEELLDCYGVDLIKDISDSKLEYSLVCSVSRDIKRLRCDTLDHKNIILYLSKYNISPKEALSAIKAGFSTEELIKFPFLVSPLVNGTRK